MFHTVVRHLVFLCLLLQFWLQFTCVHIYIRYFFFPWIIKIISFLSHPLGRHWSLSMCLGCSVLLQFTFYQICFSMLNTLDNVSSFGLSVRCCNLATLHISSDLNYLFIWNIIIRQCVKLWFISWDVVIGYTIRSSAPFFIGSTFSDFSSFLTIFRNFSLLYY